LKGRDFQSRRKSPPISIAASAAASNVPRAKEFFRNHCRHNCGNCSTPTAGKTVQIFVAVVPLQALGHTQPAKQDCGCIAGKFKSKSQVIQIWETHPLQRKGWATRGLCSWGYKPSGVVSLLDMLKRYAFSFYEVVSRIEYMRHEAKALGSFGGAYTSPTKVYEHSLDKLKLIFTDMRAECQTLDLISTTDLVTHIEKEVQRKGKDYTYVDLSNHLDTLCFSFEKELIKNSCFRIAAEKDKYFEKGDLFGLKVNTAFPSCVDEIRNAGNCYALEQDDACVFHCMRVLELALRVLAKELGVTFAGMLDLQNWQNIIENIESEIKKLEKLPKGKYKSETLKLFSQAAMQFRWFKEAWRNHVMHGRDVYDAGKAYSILGHVKELVQALAEGGLKE
jgi:hypothetical protein